MLQPNELKPNFVNKEDLEHLCQLVEMKDGGPPWIQMMDRSAPNMSYKAWQRDPKVSYLLFWLKNFFKPIKW